MTTKRVSNLQKHFRILWLVLGIAAMSTLMAIWGNTRLVGETPEKVALQTYRKSKKHWKSVGEPIENIIIANDSHVTSWSDKMRLAERELEDRRNRVENLCNDDTNDLSLLKATISKMIVDIKHGISWCPVYKAASSVWMEHFAVLGKVLSDMTTDLVRRDLLQINTIVRQAFPTDLDTDRMLEDLSRTKTFVIVRHPFERLLSAYRDKLERLEGRQYYYKRFGRHIANRYRGKRNLTKLEPTFGEFLQFIAEEKYFDEHWAPYYDTCRPCSIRYDYILKCETFDRDQSYLIRKLGLDDFLYTGNNLKNINPKGSTTSRLKEKYFEGVPRSLLKKIHWIYESDFELFSYSPAEYYAASSLEDE